MAGDKDLELDAGDLLVTAADLVLVDEEDLIRQRIEVSLRTFLREWFLNAEAGIPYYDSIFGAKGDLEGVDAIFKAAVMKVAGVNRILGYESSLDQATREFTVAFTVDTIYGPVELDEVLP